MAVPRPPVSARGRARDSQLNRGGYQPFRRGSARRHLIPSYLLRAPRKREKNVHGGRDEESLLRAGCSISEQYVTLAYITCRFIPRVARTIEYVLVVYGPIEIFRTHKRDIPRILATYFLRDESKIRNINSQVIII